MEEGYFETGIDLLCKEDSYSHMEDLIDVEATHTLDMRSTTTVCLRSWFIFG